MILMCSSELDAKLGWKLENPGQVSIFSAIVLLQKIVLTIVHDIAESSQQLYEVDILIVLTLQTETKETLNNLLSYYN